jgi:hypothetical protein
MRVLTGPVILIVDEWTENGTTGGNRVPLSSPAIVHRQEEKSARLPLSVRWYL